MKLVMIVVTTIWAAGCATAPSMNCDESCAMQNMACVGQDMGESTGESQARWKYGDSISSALNPRIIDNSSSSKTFHCVKDPSQAAAIEEFRAQALMRSDDSLYKSRCSSLGSLVNGPTRRVCERWKARKKESVSDQRCAPDRIAKNPEDAKICAERQAAE
jgi:hypothetical protein